MHFNPVTAKLATVADLGDSDVRKLVALCEDVRVVPSKHDILSEGERPDHVHVIIEGWAARYKTLANGSRQIVAFLYLATSAICTSRSSGEWTMESSR